jgi:transposase-like protein
MGNENNTLQQFLPELPECKYCKGRDVIKYGNRHNKKGKVQVYWCKKCRRMFTEKTTFSRMKHKGKIITVTLDLYFKNVSLRNIKNHLKQFHEVEVGHVTVLNWIRKYSEIISGYTGEMKINSCSVIHADEMMVKVNGKWCWLWDVMDKDSRFIVSSLLSKRREGPYAQVLFEEAKWRGGTPRLIVTDGYAGYKYAKRKAFGNFPRTRDVEHMRLIHFREKANNNIMERLMGQTRERTKIMRGFGSLNSAKSIMGGWVSYYNFIRPHMGLNGFTPAEMAGIDLGLNGGNRWEEIIRKAEGNA